MPYFIDFEEQNKDKFDNKYATVDDYLMEKLVNLSKTAIDIKDREFDWNEDV